MELNLKNKTALVCGSTQGIGLETAKTLADLGATCILVARNEEKLKTACDSLSTNKNQQHSYLIADFSNPETLKTTINQFAAKNQVNILINNTGGPKGGPIVDAEINEFTATFNQHLVCNHILVQALLPGMKALGYGRIVNVISTSVKQPLDGLGVSNTIRGAVANWSKTLANELGQFNITVNNVLPGATDTVRLKEIIENKALKTGKSVTDIKTAMANQSPMKRIAKPQEVANAICFLCSPAASYINGINVPVDGGRTKSL